MSFGFGSDGSDNSGGFGDGSDSSGGFGGGGWGSNDSGSSGVSAGSVGSIGGGWGNTSGIGAGSVGSTSGGYGFGGDSSSGSNSGSLGFNNNDWGNISSVLGNLGNSTQNSSNLGSLMGSSGVYGGDFSSTPSGMNNAGSYNSLGTTSDYSSTPTTAGINGINSLNAGSITGSIPGYGTTQGMFSSNPNTNNQNNNSAWGAGSISPSTQNQSSLGFTANTQGLPATNAEMTNAANNSTMGTFANYMQKIAPYASVVNPVAGLAMGLTGMGLKSYNNSDYGVSSNLAGAGGSLGGTIGGAIAGVPGALAGSALGNLGTSALQGNQSNVAQSGVNSTLGTIANGIFSNISPTVGALASVAAPALASYAISKQQQNIGNDMLSRADPFGSQRGQYATQLQNLQSNPQSITSLPAYQAAYNQAMQAGLRTMGSQGQLGNGAAVSALGTKASDLASQTYETEANRLANLAGSGISNSSAIAAGLQQQAAAKTSQNNALYTLLQQLSSYGS